jgi:hypothetical protein
MELVGELKGVQYALLAFPDRISPPGAAVVGPFVQNAHSKPRRIRGTLSGGPLGGAVPFEFLLEGGESGIFRIPVEFRWEASARTAPLRLKFSAEAPGGVGKRVIRRNGHPSARLPLLRDVQIEVGGGRAGPPANPQAQQSAGFASFYRPGQPQPDLSPLHALQALRAEPPPIPTAGLPDTTRP